MHNALLDDVIPSIAADSAASEPRLTAGTINRVTGTGPTTLVWAVIDGFDGYEWGPLEHRPFRRGEVPAVGARCAIGIYSDEKWLVGLDETTVTSATWYSGTTAPSGGLGADGDLYLDTTGNAWYGPKAVGVWGSAHPLTPPTIPPSFLVGTGVPAAGTGRDGDAYIDRATGLVYAPKATGAWPAGIRVPTNGLTPTAKTAGYTAVSGDLVQMTGSFTVTLPTPAAGAVVGVISVNGTGAAPCTVTTPSGVINGPGAGAASILLGVPGADVILEGDGTNWNIVAGGQATGWIAVATWNGNWSNLGGSWEQAEYSKDRSGIVRLRGVIGRSATYVAGEAMINLPAGYRPAKQSMWIGAMQTGVARIDVMTNGDILWTGVDGGVANGGAPFHQSLAGISYAAA